MLLPSLEVVKPGTKNQLCETEFISFCNFLQNGCSPRNLSSVHTVTNDNNKGVYYIDNVLSDEECTFLRASIDSCKELSFWNQFDMGNDDSNEKMQQLKMFRDAETVEIDGTVISMCIWNRVKSITDYKNFEEQLTNFNCNSYDGSERDLLGVWVPSGLNSDLLFARYAPNGCFAPHTDGRTVHDFNFRSFYSVIIFLSDIPLQSGGGTRFYSDEVVNNLHCTDDGKHWTADSSHCFAEVESVAGRMLIFHQSLVHEGVPTAVGAPCKYIIRSDVMFRRTPEVCNSESDRAAFKLFQQAEELAEAGSVDESIRLFKKAFKMSPEMARMMGHS